MFTRLLDGRFGVYDPDWGAAAVVEQAKATVVISLLGKISDVKPSGRDTARGLFRVMMPSPRAVIFTGWFWMLVLLAEFVLALYLRIPFGLRCCLSMVSSSGLLYLFPYTLVTPAPDFRYFYWCSIAASLGVVALVCG